MLTEKIKTSADIQKGKFYSGHKQLWVTETQQVKTTRGLLISPPTSRFHLQKPWLAPAITIHFIIVEISRFGTRDFKLLHQLSPTWRQTLELPQ